jgi:hypothetical protein
MILMAAILLSKNPLAAWAVGKMRGEAYFEEIKK